MFDIKLYNEQLKVIQNLFQQVFEEAMKNNSGRNELLLVSLNFGYMSDSVSLILDNLNNSGANYSKQKRLIYDDAHRGWVWDTFQKFISQYISNSNHNDSIAPEKQEFLIQIEMLIYLKFWESDYILNYLHRFSEILKGNGYHWEEKLTGYKRNEKINDIIQNFSANGLKNILAETYKENIRNSIAHSQYSFIFPAQIDLNTYDTSKKNKQEKNEFREKIKTSCFLNKRGNWCEYSALCDPKEKGCWSAPLSFEDWNKIFTQTCLIYQGIIRLDEIIENHFQKIYRELGNVRIMSIANCETRYLYLKYDEERKRWLGIGN